LLAGITLWLPRTARLATVAPVTSRASASFLLFFIATLCAGLAPAFAAKAASSPRTSTVLNLPQLRPWTGDLDGLLKRRSIRILVPYSKTLFFLHRGAAFGTVAEFGRHFEAWLNQKYKSKALQIVVTFVPVSRERLLPALIGGQGDIAAANLTITPERDEIVDFSDPWMKNVDEIIVTGPTGPNLATIEDLSGQQVYVRPTSSHATHLAALNDSLAAKHLPPVKIVAADESLEDEDLMEMVNAGLLPLAVVDDHMAALWAQIFTHLTVRSDLVLHTDGEIAWAVREHSPKLLALLNEFFQEHGAGSTFANIIRRRYFSDAKIVKNAYSEEDVEKFQGLLDYFKRYGDQYSFDYLMIAAQGYQESQLDQSRRSPRGAVGVMQLMPKTAAHAPIGVVGVDKDAARNILAGTKYLRVIVDQYLDDPAIDAKNRMLMAFAAYNAGPRNLQKFRRLAAKSGLDPDIWFNNVENAAARLAGRETVQYVSNIYKYYIAYTLLMDRAAAAEEARKAMEH
jgi:membrane-bound lytic murein transglycosylase MltF